MPKYHVAIQEIHTVTVEVEADDELDAILNAAVMDITDDKIVQQEYSETRDMEYWTAKKVK